MSGQCSDTYIRPRPKSRSSFGIYLLRCVLKVTLYAARNFPLRVAELAPTSSSYLKVGQNQITLSRGISSIPIFNDFIALRSRRAASWPRGAPGFAWSYFAPQRVPRLSQSQENATTTILD